MQITPARILLLTKTYQDVIQAYVARAYHARGAFAVHTWIATKPKNAEQYTVYQVVGWNLYRNLPALSISKISLIALGTAKSQSCSLIFVAPKQKRLFKIQKPPKIIPTHLNIRRGRS